MSLDAIEARRAELDWERWGPPGGERERLARLDPTFDHPWLICLCDPCRVKRDRYRYPGPCAACGSELRRPSLHLIDGQGSVLCRAGYLHRLAS